MSNPQQGASEAPKPANPQQQTQNPGSPQPQTQNPASPQQQSQIPAVRSPPTNSRASSKSKPFASASSGPGQAPGLLPTCSTYPDGDQAIGTALGK